MALPLIQQLTAVVLHDELRLVALFEDRQIMVGQPDASGGWGWAAVTAPIPNNSAPTGLTYASNAMVLVKGTPLAPAIPFVSGLELHYTVSPALPDGLAMDQWTGVITGTPTTITAPATYTVTATNSYGHMDRAVTIVVYDTAPNTLAYAGDPYVYTKSSAIVSVTPTHSGGTVVSYSVSPALPDGLALNTSTGVLSGTPIGIAPFGTYAVTAHNLGGSTMFNLHITVKDIAPAALTYGDNPGAYTQNVAIAPNAPSHTGGAVVTYGVSPALPEGLTMDATTGIIIGTPTVTSEDTVYTVTATNTGGSTTCALHLSVS